MKILVVSQYFYPEEFKVNEMVEEFVKRGHEVTVLTGKPNYPQGVIYNGYSALGYKKEKYKGMQIIRVPLIPRRKSSGSELAINYASYIFFSCLYILFHRKKYDITFGYSLSPMMQVYASLLYKKLHGIKAYMWVQDLWPESVTAAGKMDKGIAYNILEKMVRNIYRNMDGIFIQSPTFVESIEKRGISRDKLFYTPNWAEELFGNANLVDFRKYQDIVPKGFVVMFAGNVGEAQDFDSIIQAAILTKQYYDIKWVIVGDGRKKAELEKIIISNNLEGTVKMLGRYPVREMPSMFIHSDVMLVSLKDEYIFSLTIPSKIQSYMAFGKPIVSMINGIGNKVIEEAKCGFIAQAGDYTSLANNVLAAYKMDQNALKKIGYNGKSYYEHNFSKNQIIDKILSVIES